MPKQSRFYHRQLAVAIATTSILSQGWFNLPAIADTASYCRFTATAIAEKEKNLQAALKGNVDSEKNYQTLLRKHAERLQQCRSKTWPSIQAIWLRLYPCDIRPGGVEAVLDQIVNLGYNQVNLEVFYDGQVLLPTSDNPTAWPSILRSPGTEGYDLLAQVIQKGHERGLRVYAWMFSMNFGYTYAQRADRKTVLARNGKGQTSLDVVQEGNQVFIDPYNKQAKMDYYLMVQKVVSRRPDGILFDYIRYPRQTGSESVSSEVKDLWIYSDAAMQALYERAINNKGRELIRRFVAQGYVSAEDIDAVDKLYPQEGSPLWQGRTPNPIELQVTPAQRQPLLQWELWQLTVAHAAQGILDFLALATYRAQQLKMPAGAVFFPDGNQVIGQGYDSRLQPWNSFSSSLEWHPMSYALCNGNSNCIAAQVQRVLSMAPAGTAIIPALAGVWGKSMNDRPPLEAQMQAIQQVAPQLNALSHFAYSWQEPDSDRARKFCKLP